MYSSFFKKMINRLRSSLHSVKNQSHYAITTITSFKQALADLNKADQKTIIFFDIDYTLINPVDPMGRYYAIPFLFKVRALLRYPQLLLRKNMEYYYSIVWLHEKWTLTELEVAPLIEDLKNRGCIVLALSAIESGSFGLIRNFPEWHFELLKKLGVVFTQDFDTIIFDELPKHGDSYPKLYGGILCCNGQTKNGVAEAFLKRIAIKPDQIIFVDDIRSNVIALQKLCIKKDIDYKGFEYYNAPWRSRKWNESRSRWQLDYLIKNKKWVTDHQYAEMKKNEEKIKKSG